MMAGRHIHHLVLGILTLLLVGYGWLRDIGTGTDSTSMLASRLMSVLYGVGDALTLDEFASGSTCARSVGRGKDAPALTQ